MVKIAQFSFEFIVRLTMRTIKALLRGKMVGNIVTIRGATLSPFRFCGCEYPIAQTPASAALGACYTVQVISKTRLSRDSLLKQRSFCRNKSGLIRPVYTFDIVCCDCRPGVCNKSMTAMQQYILFWCAPIRRRCSCQFSISGKISIVRQKYHMCERTLRFQSYSHWNNLYPLNVRSSRLAVLKTRIWLYKSKQLHINSINYENQSSFISNQFL